MFDMIRKWFEPKEEAAAAAYTVQTQGGIVRFIIALGGSGNVLAALESVFQLARPLYLAATGRPDLTAPTLGSVDLDAGSRGASLMMRMAEARNNFAESDKTGAVCGPIQAINASVSQNMDDSTDENSIDDMVAGDPEARQQISAVLTPGESARPRKDGGYGVPRVTRMWSNTILRTDTMVNLIDEIRQAYLDGKKVVVTLAGSGHGATGATLLNTVPKRIYEVCQAANPQAIGNLRIHNIILLGYAAHPASGDADDGILLDSGEDAVKAANWWHSRQREGIDAYVQRTYLVDSKKVIACDKYSIGGEQYRHFTLGDLYGCLALKESLETAFDASRDGCRIFLARTGGENDPRVRWDMIEDVEFRESFVNMVRFAAFMWLKIRPMTIGVGDDILRRTPHIRRMLGDRPTAADLKKVTEPLEALLDISREVLIAAREIAATGMDYSSPTAVLGNYDTVLFDPHLIDDILSGRITGGEDVNGFELDELNTWDLGGSNIRTAFTTDVTVGEVYLEAVTGLERGDSAAQFALQVYRSLRV